MLWGLQGLTLWWPQLRQGALPDVRSPGSCIILSEPCPRLSWHWEIHGGALCILCRASTLFFLFFFSRSCVFSYVFNHFCLLSFIFDLTVFPCNQPYYSSPFGVRTSALTCLPWLSKKTRPSWFTKRLKSLIKRLLFLRYLNLQF